MIIKTKLTFYLFILLLLGVFSCSKEVEEPQDMGYDYFPVEQGIYSIYEVRAIIWDDNDQSVDTSFYQEKRVIDTIFTDNMGRKSYKWIRYTKTDTSDWKYEHTYAITKTTGRLETIEGNNRYLRLAFPVQLANNWDENAFNAKDEMQAKYIDVDMEKTINNKKFDQCAIVLLEDNTSLVNEYYQEEIYARGVGLIDKIDTHINKEISGKITKGYKYTYHILTYGKE